MTEIAGLVQAFEKVNSEPKVTENFSTGQFPPTN